MKTMLRPKTSAAAAPAPAKKEDDAIGRVILKGVRLSFFDGWRPKSITRADGTESTPKYSANFLTPKDGSGKAVYKGKAMPIMAALKAAKMDALVKKLGESEGAKAKVKPQNYCVKDGDLETYDGYQNMYFISANNSKQPKIVGKDKRPLSEKDGIPYSGCYVNAVVTLWCQKPGNVNGEPRPLAVFGSLEAIQFLRHGEAFGAKPVDIDSVFDDETDEDDVIGGDEDEDEDEDML